MMERRTRAHTAIVAAALAGCARPPAPPPVQVAPIAAPAGVREGREAGPAGPAVRVRQTTCDDAICWVSVELTGSRQVSSQDVLDAMLVLQGHPFTQELLDRDVLVLSALYYDRGYLEVKIEPPAVDRTHDHEVRIGLSIDEGPQYRIQSVDAREDRSGLRCPPIGGWTSPLGPGDVFDRSRLISDLSRLKRAYRDRGYAKVEATPRTTLDPERRLVKLSIVVTRGAVHTFGRVLFSGNRRVTEAELRRRIEIVPGARFSETALERSKALLLASGLFDEVEAGIEDGRTPLSTDVTFTLSERREASGRSPPTLAPVPAPQPAIAEAPEDGRGCKAIPEPRVIRASHILIGFVGAGKAPPGVTRSREEAARLAQAALRRIRDGASFAEVAKAYTDEPGGADRGGDLGEFDDEAMVESFSNAAFRLRVGEVSDIVETQYGLHIILRTK